MTNRIDYLSPFRTKHRLDGRAYRDRIGRPYYGSTLRAVIEAKEPTPSVVDRVTTCYMASRWAPWALLVIGAAFFGAAIVLATWMVR